MGRPKWNPEKQTSGQILDKFGVRGVFECCKGKKGSQRYMVYLSGSIAMLRNLGPLPSA